MKRFLSPLLLLIIILTGRQETQGQTPISIYHYSTSGYNCSSDTFTIYRLEYDPTVNQWEWYLDGNLVSSDSLFKVVLPQGNHHIDLYGYFNAIFTREGYLDIYVNGSEGRFYPQDLAELCLKEKAEFKVESGDIDTIYWDFGDGILAGMNYAEHYFTTIDTFNVTARITYMSGCPTDTLQQRIIVKNNATPKFDVEIVHEACPNDIIDFSYQGKLDSVYWDFGDLSYSSIKNPTYSYAVADTYMVVLEGFNTCGGSNTDTAYISIRENINANPYFSYWTQQSASSCPGQTVNFQAEGPGVFYQWEFGDGNGSMDTKNPSYRYPEEGMYYAKLTVENGCGSVMTSDSVYIDVYAYGTTIYPEIQFDMYDGYMINNDTLHICPGEKVKLSFNNVSGDMNEDGYKYRWYTDLTADTIYTRDAIMNFPTETVYTIYLDVMHPCGYGYEQTMTPKFVKVGNAPIYANPNFAPFEVCDSEYVYFWNEGPSIFDRNYTVDIIFGDSESQTGISDYSDPINSIIATHQYPIGTYPVTMRYINTCNDTLEYNDTISADLDNLRIPDILVENSTYNGNDKDPQDWSTYNTDYHQFYFEVNYDFSSVSNGNYFLFFYYGGMNQAEGSPDGYVMQQLTPGASGLDYVYAYIPVPSYENTIGVAAAWYCDSNEVGNAEPNFTAYVDSLGYIFTDFEITPAGYTDVYSEYAGSIYMSPTGCDTTKRFNGQWRNENNGRYAFLDIWEDGAQQYDLSISDHPYQQGDHISSGDFTYTGTDLYFYDHTNYLSGNYYFYLNPAADTLIVYNNVYTDMHMERKSALENKVFTRYDESHQYAACPGDTVEFQLAGGNNATWYFGDGDSLEIDINDNIITKHVYDNAGVYDAFAVVSNNCGRTKQDTTYTKVIVDSLSSPGAYLKMPQMEFIGKNIPFRLELNQDRNTNYKYEWRFDNKGMAYVKDPVYAYSKPGTYEVRVKVSNSCGSWSNEQTIVIEDTCHIISRFMTTQESDSVFTFSQNIYGNYDNFNWDINGAIINNQNIVSSWSFPMNSIANINLYAYNTTTGCADTLKRRMYIGYENVISNCGAGFYPYFNTFNEVQFYPQVYEGNLVHFDWDYGDGGSFDTDNPSPIHIYSEAGVYYVCMTSYDETYSPCNTYCDSVYVYGVQNCFADFGAETNGTLTVPFDNYSSGTYTEAIWDFGDGTSLSDTSFFINHTYNEAGNYTVCLLVIDDISGCTDEYCTNIIVDDGSLVCYADFYYEFDSTTNEWTFHSISSNAQTYYWNFGDGIGFGTDSIVTYQYPNPGVYEVTLMIDNGNTCWDEITKQITYGSLSPGECFADFMAQPITGSNIVEFYNKSISGTPMKSGFYDFGDGTYSYDNPNPVHTYAEPGKYWVCGSITTEAGCQSDICKWVIAGEPPCHTNFEYQPDPTTMIIQFFADSTGADEYYWDFGDGSFEVGPEPNHRYLEPGYYMVCLQTYDMDKDCWSDMCQEIEILSKEETVCNVYFSQTIDSITRTLNVAANSNTLYTEWFWDFGDGSFATSKDTSHTYSSDGVYQVCLSAYDQISGCFSERCKVFIITSSTITDQLTADYSAVNLTGTQNVKFRNKSTGNISESYWTFGDGTFSNAMDSIRHTYPSDGFWNSCLLVFNNSSFNSSEKCKRIFVGDATACRLNAEFNQMIIPDSLKVSFKDKTTGGAYKWFWNFGDGNTSTKKSPAHYYTKAGYYLITLSVQDTTGNCIDHTAKFLQIGTSQCKANFDFVVNTSTNSAQFKNRSNGNITDYFWSFDDGTFSTDTNPVHTFNPGIYNVSLTVSNGTGCVDYFFEQVQVGQVPCNADFTVHVDETNMAYFDNKVLGGTNKLQWIFGDGFTSEEYNPTHKYTFPGIYTVELYAYTGTCMDHSEATIIVGQRGSDMQASFVHTIDEATKTVEFFDRSVGVDEATNYIWDFGDSTFAYTANAAKTYSEGGYYFVCLTILGDNGMQNTSCQMVRVAPPPNKNCLSDFFYTVDSASLTATFTSNSVGVGASDNYEWRLGHGVTDASGPSITHTFDSAAYYNVGLKIRNDATHCTSVEYKMINVGKRQEGLKAGFVFEQDTSNLKAGGYPVDFVGTASPPKPAKFSWDFGDKKKAGGYSTTSRVTHIYAATGTYIVCYTIEDPNTGETDEYCQVCVVSDETGMHDVLFDELTLNNFPNPFDQFTNIKYTLPKETFVELMVMDNLGREIETLVRTTKTAGNYEYLWDTSELPAGMYILRLSTSDGVVKIKMAIKK